MIKPVVYRCRVDIGDVCNGNSPLIAAINEIVMITKLFQARKAKKFDHDH